MGALESEHVLPVLYLVHSALAHPAIALTVLQAGNSIKELIHVFAWMGIIRQAQLLVHHVLLFLVLVNNVLMTLNASHVGLELILLW